MNVQFDHETVASEFIKNGHNLLYRTGSDDLHTEEDGSALRVDRCETMIYKVSKCMNEGDL
ncbi:hypothetical protein D3C84_1258260 [compost metagenome]